MGTLIKFPGKRRMVADGCHAGALTEAATIIILPVIRIERAPDHPTDGLEPGAGAASGRKRRRRNSRS